MLNYAKFSKRTFFFLGVCVVFAGCWSTNTEQNQTSFSPTLPDSTGGFLPGEAIPIGTLQGHSQAIRVEFSSDSGQSWRSLTDSMRINGDSVSLIAPDVSSKTCMVKVATTNRTVTSKSFTINSLVLISPTSGDTLKPGEDLMIRYKTSDPNVTDVLIRFFPVNPNAPTIHVASRTLPIDSTGYGEYKWSVPKDVTSTSGRFFVADYLSQFPFDHNSTPVVIISDSWIGVND